MMQVLKSVTVDQVSVLMVRDNGGMFKVIVKSPQWSTESNPRDMREASEHFDNMTEIHCNGF